MAPRTKGNGVKSLDPVSASTDNGQPPPSTLAAQIVQQHAADRNKKVEFSTFHQLLAEIRSNPLAVEDDVESNAKLIKVIVDAGLNQHAIHEALARMPNGEQQIVACLDVIQIVTNRTPSVLKQDIGSADAYLDLFIIRKLLDLSRVKLLRFSVRILALSLPLAATGKYDRGARSISTQAVLRAWASGKSDQPVGRILLTCNSNSKIFRRRSLGTVPDVSSRSAITIDFWAASQLGTESTADRCYSRTGIASEEPRSCCCSHYINI